MSELTDVITERGVLASCLVSPTTAMQAVMEAGVTENSFYFKPNADVYKAVLSLWEKGHAIDTLTVRGEMMSVGCEEPSVLIGELVEGYSMANPTPLLKTLAKLEMRRKLYNTAVGIAERAKNVSDDTVLDDAAVQMIEATQTNTIKKATRVGLLMPQFMEDLNNAQRNGTPGVSTGFKGLDAATGGFMPSDLIIIGGRPSMGKSALAVNIATNAAMCSMKTIIFSLEMSQAQVVQRIVSRDSGIGLHNIRTGKVASRDLPEIALAAGRIYERPLYIDDTGHVSLSHIRAVMMSISPQLVFIDYLQLANGNPQRGESRQQEIGKISRGLKALAKEFNIPVVALSQISRAAEQRGKGCRPMLSDLREAGDIEQDADVVMFCYREEYYFPNKEDVKGKAEVIIGKQRNGPPGSVIMRWEPRIASFADPSDSDAEVWRG